MYKDIVEKLPYKSSFLFVDNITSLDKEGVTGDYTFRKEAWFYEDHFAGNPVTPGVIITEIMAQIGLVVLGIYIVIHSPEDFPGGGAGGVGGAGGLAPLLTSTDISFYKAVLPGEKVTVVSKKQYFRFSKLKCQVEMFDSAGETIARGVIAGFIKENRLNK